MITETKVIVGTHARYHAYSFNGRPYVGLVESIDSADSIWAPVATGYGMSWQACAVMSVIGWERDTEVYFVTTGDTRKDAWDKARQASKDLSWSPLLHEYLFQGQFIVTVLRAKAVA